jgi:hypothetical protein
MRWQITRRRRSLHFWGGLRFGRPRGGLCGLAQALDTLGRVSASRTIPRESPAGESGAAADALARGAAIPARRGGKRMGGLGRGVRGPAYATCVLPTAGLPALRRQNALICRHISTDTTGTVQRCCADRASARNAENWIVGLFDRTLIHGGRDIDRWRR